MMNSLILAIVLCTSQPDPSVVLRGEVVDVYDGDTLTFDVRIRVKVRLLDCWAPELGEDGGVEAKEKLRELTEGTGPAVLAIPLGHTKHIGQCMSFGRVLGHVWVNGRNVGDELIRAGQATRNRVRR